MKKSLTIFICAFGLLAPLGLNAQAQGRNRGGGPQGGGFQGRGPEGGGPRGGGMRRGPEKMRLMRTWRGIADLEKSKTPLSKAQAKKVVALVVPASKKQTLSSTDADKLNSGLQAILTNAQKSALDDDRPFGGPREGGRFGGPGGDGPRGGGPGFGRGGDDRGPGGGGFGGRGRGEGGPGGPGGGGPGGGGPRGGGFDGPPPGGGGFGGGGRGFGDMDDSTRELIGKWMETYNPFYAPTGYPAWKKLPSQFQDRTAKRYKENRAVLEAISKKSK